MKTDSRCPPGNEHFTVQLLGAVIPAGGQNPVFNGPINTVIAGKGIVKRDPAANHQKLLSHLNILADSIIAVVPVKEDEPEFKIRWRLPGKHGKSAAEGLNNLCQALTVDGLLKNLKHRVIFFVNRRNIPLERLIPYRLIMVGFYRTAACAGRKRVRPVFILNPVVPCGKEIDRMNQARATAPDSVSDGCRRPSAPAADFKHMSPKRRRAKR